MRKTDTVKFLIMILMSAAMFSCEYSFDVFSAFPSDNSLFILTSDNMASAGFSVFHEGKMKIGSGDFHTDAVVRVQYPYVYVLNRLGRDNIQILNAQDDYKTVTEISLSQNTSTRPNPQDILFYGERALISCYDTDMLLVFNTLSQEIERSIDISEYGYGGSACPAFMYYDKKNNRAFAALQRLDRSTYLPSDYSSVLVIDPDTVEVLQQLRLQADDAEYRNPYTRFRGYDEDSVLIGCAGNFKMTGNGDDDGGVLIIHTDEPYAVEGVLLKESELGADIVDFVFDGTFLYLITLDVYGASSLVRVDPVSADSKLILKNSNGKGYLWRIEQQNNYLYICSRDVTDAGILVYDTAKNKFIFGGSISTGLPPSDMVFISAGTERVR